MKQGNPFDTSLRILALRDHSVGELRRKLKEKGYEEPGNASEEPIKVDRF